MRDEYRDLLEDARQALFKLIRESEPGTGLPLHHAYNTIKASLEKDGHAEVPKAPDPADEARERAECERREMVERDMRWKKMPWYERERMALEVLGDDALTKREFVARINASRDDIYLHESNVQGLIKRMVESGDLDKVPEQWKNRIRYRYRRRVDLSGAIAELDRVIEGGDA